MQRGPRGGAGGPPTDVRKLDYSPKRQPRRYSLVRSA